MEIQSENLRVVKVTLFRDVTTTMQFQPISLRTYAGEQAATKLLVVSSEGTQSRAL